MHRTQEIPFVQAEFSAQLQYLQSLGVPIQYVDGHHHIHLVPGLLDAIFPALQSAHLQTVRIPLDYSLLITPQAPIACLALLARRTARKNRLQWLPCIYPNIRLFKDQGLLRAKLARSPHAEVIVHPAQTNNFQQYHIADSYTEGRVTEYLALKMLQDSGS